MESDNGLEYKFMGILSGIDFENLSFDEQLNILIENEIYTMSRNSKYIFKHQFCLEISDYGTLFTVPNENLSSCVIEYRGFKYYINNSILCEIFDYMNDQIRGDDFVDEFIDTPQQKICIHLSKLLNNNERFNFCVSKYNEYYSKIENTDELLYYENTDEGVNQTWESYVVSSIYRNLQLIKQHLLSYHYYDFDFFPITKVWETLIESTEMMNFLKIQMHEYQSQPKLPKGIDLSLQLAIIEKIMKIENWDDISATKKGKILTHLLGKNDDNIKNYYLELGKKPSDVKSKFFDKIGKYQTDKLKAEKIINELLG